MEQWEQCVLANHSKFPPVADEEFLSGTRVLAAPKKIGSAFLKREFRRETRSFLEEFTNSVPSTVAELSRIGQGLSCFLPCDRHWWGWPRAASFAWSVSQWAFGRGWVRNSEIEASRAGYQSFAPAQRQLERSSTSSRLYVGDARSFCSSQADFCAHQHLFKVSILTN